MAIRGNGKSEDFETLARNNGSDLSVSTLESEADYSSPKVFTEDEVTDRRRQGAYPEWTFVKGVGEAFAIGAAGGASAYLACGRAGGKLIAMVRPRFGSPHVPVQVAGSQPPESQPIGPQPMEAQPQPASEPPPDLAEARNIVREARGPNYKSKNGSPQEVLWLGATYLSRRARGFIS